MNVISIETQMVQYKNWAPTPFDSRGAFLEKHQDWFVFPILRTRDTEDCPRTASNWEAALWALKESDETKENIEVHRFGHWGPGWIEIILIAPNPNVVSKANELIKNLEEYPILDEEDMSMKEWSAAEECWENYGHSDCISELKCEVPEELEDALEDLDQWTLFGWHCQWGSEPYFFEGSSASFRYVYSAEAIDDLIELLRESK